MQINRISNVLNYTTPTIKKTSIPQQKDVFIRTTSFNQSKNDDKSFEEFVAWANNTGYFNTSNYAELRGGLLGSGFEGKTYEIPKTDKWVLKEFKRGNMIPMKLKKTEIKKIKDISPDLNIGQFIASVKYPVNDRFCLQFYILKKQEGKTIGVHTLDKDLINTTNVKTHLTSLQALASLPNNSFDKLIKDIDYITKQGLFIDSSNPNNFMIDTKKNQINFVDIADKLENDNNQYADVLYALLDGDFAETYYNSDRPSDEKNKVQRYSNSIAGKFIGAMIRNNCKFSDSLGLHKLLNSDSNRQVLGIQKEEEKMKVLKELQLI